MKVYKMLSHGDTSTCQFWYDMLKEQRRQVYGESIILILRLKDKVIQRSWMYVTHCPMVIHSCAKYGKTVKGPKHCCPNRKTCQKHHIRIMNWGCVGGWTWLIYLRVSKIRVCVGRGVVWAGILDLHICGCLGLGGSVGGIICGCLWGLCVCVCGGGLYLTYIYIRMTKSRRFCGLCA